MPKVKEINQELVRAFNIGMWYINVMNTNFMVRNLNGKDYIVISFDKCMDVGQCIEYVSSIREKIIEKFWEVEDAHAASLSFNTGSFPFSFSEKQLNKEKHMFLVEIDEDVIFNLKCYLARVLAKDINEDMGAKYSEEYATENTYEGSVDRDLDLYCTGFDDEELQRYFIESFSTKIKGYKHGPAKISDCLEVDGDYVYIGANIFNNVKFIRDIEKDHACLIGRCLQIPSSSDPAVKTIKYVIVDFIRRACPAVVSVFHTSYLESDERSILVPLAKDSKGYRFLTTKEVSKINNAFKMAVLHNVEDRVLKNGSGSKGGMYAIDFANPEISYCVINKIIENSVISKNHELTIDPELHSRVLLPEPPFSLGKKSGMLSSLRHRFSGSGSALTSPVHESEPSSSGIKRQAPLTSSQRKELYSVLSPEMKNRLKSSLSPFDMENLLYSLYVDKRELRTLFTPEKEKIRQLRLSQLTAEQLLVGGSGNCNSQAFSSSSYGSKPSSRSLPESLLDSVDVTRFIQQCQEKQGDRVY